MIRIIVWTREAVRGAKEAGDFVIAVCELSGQMLVYTGNKYENITEEEVVTAMRDTVLDTFNRTYEDIKTLLTEEEAGASIKTETRKKTE